MADLLFATRPATGESSVICESCDVLLEAPSAIDALEKARRWAATHVEDSEFSFMGIAAMWRLGDERPGDGTEIAGTLRDSTGEQIAAEIPDPSELAAVRLEGIDSRRPLRDLLSEDEIRRLKRSFPDDK